MLQRLALRKGTFPESIRLGLLEDLISSFNYTLKEATLFSFDMPVLRP
jgi:hypothetical protein